jgi:hypothetical protein
MLTAGIFDAEVQDYYWTKSDNTGTSGLAVKVNVADPLDGSVVTMYGTIWITPKALGMARAQFRALGMDPDTVDFEDITNKNIPLIGTVVQVTLKEEVYQGQSSLRINKFGGGPVAPPQSEIQKAQAMLRAGKAKPKAGQSAPGEPDPTEPPPMDDSQF